MWLFRTPWTDCSSPGSSVHGILQVRILEWRAIPFSRGSSWPKDQTQVFRTAARFFTIWAIRVAPQVIHVCDKKFRKMKTDYNSKWESHNPAIRWPCSIFLYDHICILWKLKRNWNTLNQESANYSPWPNPARCLVLYNLQTKKGFYIFIWLHTYIISSTLSLRLQSFKY